MFYVQFKTTGKEGVQSATIKSYKKAKKVYEALARAKQSDLKLLDYQGETLLHEQSPDRTETYDPDEVCPNNMADLEQPKEILS